MNYLSLYRKYRPHLFKEVIGQEEIVLTIQNAIINQKIGHAYLFCGPRGVGKTSLAKIFAKTINCLNLTNNEACNTCYLCESFNQNNNLDLIDIDGASNNGVNEIRELKEKISLLPAMSKYKVYIIDEVHMLSISAFNALLKTLEEPPKHIIFILATTEVHKIPLTIISRCQKFDFKRINKRKIIDSLVGVLEKESITYEVLALEQIALLSEGSLRDALSILEQVIAYAKNEVTLKSVTELLSIPSKTEKLEYLLNIMQNETLKVLTLNDVFFYNGMNLRTLTMDLINICKEVMVFKITNNLQLLNILNETDIDLFKNITNEQLLNVIDNFFVILNNPYNSNLKISFEIAVFKIMENFKNFSRPLTNMNSSDYSTTEYLSLEEKAITESNSEDKLTSSESINNESEQATKLEDSTNIDINIFDHSDATNKEQNKVVKLEKLQTNVDTSDISLNETENITDNKNIISYNDDTKQVNLSLEEKNAVEIEKNIKNQIKSQRPYIWKKTDYFNLLHQSDKYLRVEYAEKWKQINQYLKHPKYHKIAKMFLGTGIIAMMEKAIFLGCINDKQANIINTYSFTKNIQEFFQEIFQEQEIVIIAVSKKELPFISQEYYQLKVANKLPEKTPINFKICYQQEKDILAKEETLNSTAYQTVQELFDNVTLVD